MLLSKRGTAFSCAALLCLCCGGGAALSDESATPALSPSSPLPPYAGRATELFDDTIEPAAVGYGGAEQSRSRKDDAILRERTQTADAVVRARVVTVTSGPEGQGAGWQIRLRTLETVAGKPSPDGEFSFFVASKGPAAGMVRMLEARLVGATFVVFKRQFGPVVGDGGDRDRRGLDLHFHFAKDDKDELGAVREAGLLGEVR